MISTEGQRKVMVNLVAALDEAEEKAWDSLARYKFQMFGYWASIWVHLNRISGLRLANPWGGIVRDAKRYNAGQLSLVEQESDDD